jgi:hypothetical protein
MQVARCVVCEGVVVLMLRCVAMRPALTHLSTMTNYTPGNYPAESGRLFPPVLVSRSLISHRKFFLFPPGLDNEFPPE